VNALRDELFFAIGQLGDFAVANQVYFFNEEDFKLVNLIKEESAASSNESSDFDESISSKEESAAQANRAIVEGKKLFTEVLTIASKLRALTNKI